MNSKSFIRLFFVLLAGFAATDLDGQTEEATPAGSLAELRGSLEKAFPTRDAVQASHRKVSARLRDYIATHATAKDVGEAQALLAEVALLGGDPSSARAAWLAMIGAGPTDDDRARGLLLLATHEWMRGKKASAGNYFRRLKSRFPESAFAKAADRPLRFLEIQDSKTREVPAFEGSFRTGLSTGGPDGPPAPRKLSSESLRGKVVLIYFWRASTAGHEKFIETFARDETASLAQAIRQFPILDGQVEVLGVSLDRDRRVFEAAVARWQVPWPQLFDERGFETPLASAFGVTQAPQWVVVGPRGRVWYLGGKEQEFYRYASAALKFHRAALEKAAAADEE